jgi:hypothetical protein
MTAKTGDAGVLIEAIAVVIDEKIRNARTVVLGKIAAIARQALGEMDVDFDAGIGSRRGGEEKGDGQAPSAPVAFPGGGGFSMRWPMTAGDECLAVCSDRNSERWRQTKLVGQAHSLDQRHHDLSDAVVLPFRITPPTPQPPASVTDEDEDWVLQGPVGDALRVGPDGVLTLTKAGVVSATITLSASGSVAIDVPTGQSVTIGGPAALSLTNWAALSSAMTSMLNALVAAGAGPAFTGATTAQTAWNTAIGLNSPETLKAKGE